MSQMPDIKPQVNKEPDRDKKKAGLLARLFGGGASGGGTVGAGAFGGVGGAAAGGGLLATKAGLLALIMIGSAVAGGIGLVGYRLFGPGQEGGGNSENLSLFAPKPKEEKAADATAPKDGSSQSLNYLSQANTTPAAPAVAPDAATKDATAASAAPDAAASANGGAAAGSANGGAINAANGTAATGKMLKNVGKFGALSTSFGGGGAAVTGGAPGKSGSTGAELAAAAAKGGNAKGSGKGAAAQGGSARAAVGRRSNGALKQAFGTLADNRGAQTSYAGGRTYDGSAASNGNNIGSEGSAIGMPGVESGANNAQPKSLPGSANDSKQFTAPPTPNATDAAPWQGSINKARLLLGIAVALMLIAKLCAKIPGYGQLIVRAIAAIIAVMGGMIVMLGSQIAHGQYGQKLQGGMLTAAGAGLMIAAAGMAFGGDSKAPGADSDNPGASGMDTDGSVDSSSGGSGSGGGFTAGVNPFVLVGGGVALVGLAGSMMMPIKKYPSSDFPNGNVPDGKGFFGYRQLPSEQALKKMIA